MPNQFDFIADISTLNRLHRLRLNGVNLSDTFRVYNNELEFIKDLPDNIKQNVINSFNCVYLAEK